MRKNIIKVIALLLLIIVTSAILLYIDQEQKADLTSYNVALIPQSGDRHSNDVIAGIEDGLKEQGFGTNKNLRLNRFEAGKNQSETADASTLILRNKVDMVLTLGWQATDGFRLKNDKTRIPHVFGMLEGNRQSGGFSAEPVSDRNWTAGFTSFLSIDEFIETLREFNPALKHVGVITGENRGGIPAKSNGIKITRLTIDEKNNGTTAVSALIAAKVEAIIILAEDSQLREFNAMTQTAANAGIPVFGRSVYELENGALACLETDYFAIGRLHGLIAGEILMGEKTEHLPFKNLLPLNLLINTTAAKNFKDKWMPTPELIAKAAEIFDGKELKHNQEASRNLAGKLFTQIKPIQKTKKNLLFVNYNEATSIEENMNGFLAGMERGGYRFGENFEIKIVNIQENLTEAANIFRNADNSTIDAILLTSTPLLETGIQIVKVKPVIFAVVADPSLACPGKDFKSTHANVTGVSSMSDFAGMATLIRKCMPAATKVGTLFDPSEKNSMRVRDLFAEELKKQDLELISEPSHSAGDVVSAADRLARHGIDVLCQISDNLHNRTFSGISNIGYMNRIPVFTFVKTNALQHGAAVAMAYNYEDGGRQQAAATIKIMQGVKPADIQIMQSPKPMIIINTINAHRCGLKIPQTIIDQADMVIE